MLQSNAGPIITRAFDPHKESIAIDVVPNRGGMGVVRVMCRFESNGVVDEGEYELPVNVQSDTAVIETIRIVREERSLGGQRYRFGGRFMVPIDASERVSREDIENKPELIGRVVARGGNGQNRRVRCVAFIDKSGHARSVRVLAQDGLSVDEARAVEKAALKARYRPARAGQKLVADWVIVDVYLEER
jgi:hypothetical protein